MDHGVFALTGLPVACIATALAAGAIIIGVVVVPRQLRTMGRHESETGRGAALRAVLLQSGTLLLCVILTLVTVLLWVNRSFIFFGSWEDMLSDGDMTSAAFGATVPAVAAAAQTDGALATARTAPVTKLQATPLKDSALHGIRSTEGGQYLDVTINAHASDVTQGALVYLPKGYLQHPERRYPVLLAFSGIPGSPATWQQSFDIGGLTERMAAEGELQQAIILIPIVYPGRNDTECVDPSDGHSRYETWLAQDLAGWAREHLRTIEDPQAWATIGYSAGGWCASMLSVRHPELARNSISLGGYFTVDYTKGQQHTAPDDPAYDLPTQMAEHAPPVQMYFFAGGEDKWAEPSLGRMQKAIRPPASLTVERTTTGGHMVPLWIRHTPDSLRWLSRAAPAFAGASSAS